MNNKDEQDNINEMLVRSGDHLMNRAAQYREQPVQVPLERKDLSSRYRSVLMGAAASIAVLVVGFVAINGESEVPGIQLAASSVESSNAISSDSAMRLSGEMIFTLADGVDIAGSKQDVWKWGTPTETDAKDIAQRLGITDQVERNSEYGGIFKAGNLTVMANGGWSYYNNDGSTVPSCVAPPVSAGSDQAQDGSSVVGCVLETLPDAVSLPSDSEARAKTLEILGDGFTVKNVMRTAWDVTVDGVYVVEGHDTYWGLVGFSDYGRITTAYGLLGKPSNVGKYRTISASEALPRLNSGMFMASDNVRATTDVACPQNVSCDPEGFVGAPTLCGETETPCTTTVILTSVRRTYTLLYDSANTVWVVPAYEYSDANGGTWTAMALDDSYLEKADVSSIDTDSVPAPVEPMPVPLPDETDGGSVEPVPTIATSAPIGLSELEAIKLIESEGFTARVIARDGESLPATKDYRLDRVNISIENGVVVSAELG
jgi:hypothetical protein